MKSCFYKEIERRLHTFGSSYYASFGSETFHTVGNVNKGMEQIEDRSIQGEFLERNTRVATEIREVCNNSNARWLERSFQN